MGFYFLSHFKNNATTKSVVMCAGAFHTSVFTVIRPSALTFSYERLCEQEDEEFTPKPDRILQKR